MLTHNFARYLTGNHAGQWLLNPHSRISDLDHVFLKVRIRGFWRFGLSFSALVGFRSSSCFESGSGEYQTGSESQLSPLYHWCWAPTNRIRSDIPRIRIRIIKRIRIRWISDRIRISLTHFYYWLLSSCWLDPDTFYDSNSDPVNIRLDANLLSHFYYWLLSFCRLDPDACNDSNPDPVNIRPDPNLLSHFYYWLLSSCWLELDSLIIRIRIRFISDQIKISYLTSTIDC